jgi:integrase
MAIIQKCICGRNNGEKRKKCSDPACGRSLMELRKQDKIQFYVVVKGKWEPAGNSLDQAKASEGKRRAQVKENRILDIQADGTMLLGQVIEDYLNAPETKLNKGFDKVTYDEICKKMRNGLTETFGHMMAKDLTRQALIDYAVKRFQAGNRPATIHKIMVYFHKAVLVAVMQEKIPARVEWKFKGLGKELSDLIGSIKNERKYVFTPAQIQAVFNSTSNLKHRAIFEILFHTGMRKGELAKMVWGDIQNGFAVLRAEITKTHQRRVVPLNRYSLAAFAELRKLNPLATDAERILDYPLDRRSWGEKQMKKACEAAGAPYGSNLKIDDEHPDGGAGYHTFRHTFISHATLSAWVPESLVRAMTGHTDNGKAKDAHQGYIHATPENLMKGIERWTMWYESTLPAQPQKIDNTLTQPLLLASNG